MAKGKALLALAAGFGSGYLDERDAINLRKEREEDRKRTREIQDIQLARLRQDEQDRIALRAAAAPREVNEGAATLDLGDAQPIVHESADMAAADYRQARTMGLQDVQAPTP